ncbi:peptidoglycan DD-metalloendopeptidase family protein [Desulfobacter latus]|uniref:Peptidoglycan DD-metalloendopeptidase family protein n=1 Tax=Desulfobacter latus TaxID=2292 RepID=A0A850TAV7_9BACT|nr:peptidoglycan DD-metalloendopeptidase family protein [Desulfobacter latus]NWH06535.1 peptidoglycan DD-metalloendopeptidase family protein [Desulfobacter latus]
MLYFPETDFKAMPRKIGPFFFACIMAAAFILGRAGLCYPQVLYKGKINTAKLNVRSAPDNRASVVVVLNRGERVNVLEMKGGVGGWLTVEYQGMQGYIRNHNRYILLKPVSARPKQKQKPVPPNPTPFLSPTPPAKGIQKTPDESSKTSGENHAGQKIIARQIREEDRKVKEFSRQEVQIIDRLNEIDMALNRARTTARNLRRNAVAIAQEIERTQARIANLNNAMKKTQDYAGKRLNALFRMHMLGRLEMAGPPSSLFNFVTTQNALKKVVTSDFALLDKQARTMAALTGLEQDLNSQHKLKSDLQKQLADEIEIRKKETRKKENILKEIRRRKRLSLAAINALKISSQALNRTISAMPSPAGSSRIKTSFAEHKGRLQFPLKGKIISTFGTKRKGDYNAFTFQSGIDIKAERGTPVKTVFNGEVMFARWLKGYGNLMIINHGNNYYTLYAHVEELYKKKGERVNTGEIIATAGDTGSIKGPCLHFEVRHHGKPVDPLRWLKKGAG